VIAVTCVSATIRPSLPLCPRPPSTLSLCPKFRALDPRPRPPAPRDVHANDRPALLWIRRTPNDFCNCTSDARTHSRAPDSRQLQRPFCGDAERALASTTPFWGALFKACPFGACFWSLVAFPCRRRFRDRCEPLQPLRGQSCRAASTRQDVTPNTVIRSRRRLRATPRSDHRLRRWPLGDDAGSNGPSSPE